MMHVVLRRVVTECGAVASLEMVYFQVDGADLVLGVGSAQTAGPLAVQGACLVSDSPLTLVELLKLLLISSPR